MRFPFYPPALSLTLLLIASLATGCVASHNAVFDDAEQVVEIEGLAGDWLFGEDKDPMLIRVVPMNDDGLAGYRTAWLDITPRPEPAADEPPLLVMDLTVGVLGERLIGQFHWNEEAIHEALPGEDWKSPFEEEQPRYLLFPLEIDDDSQRLTVYGDLDEQYLYVEALWQEDDPPNLADGPGAFHTFDDDAASVRHFLADHADRLWKYEQGWTAIPAEPGVFDEHFEHITGRTFDDAFGE